MAVYILCMTQTSREEFLRELGYEEPFDESPVEVPDGWHGGSVVNTGGHIMCRIWKTWTVGKKGRETEFEVIYNVSEYPRVDLQAYSWDDEYECYIVDHTVRSRDADERDDRAQAEIARDLMLQHNQ
jgi:hypothetical protein